MDLWIRSQDREKLTKVDGIYYDYKQEKRHIAVFTNDNYYWVGTYQTKARALEVLDEIQDILNPNGLKGSIINASRINTYVYEMPKE